jgi:putative NADH-flavin reductase
MKILIFGAAGKTGREVVIQALSLGHEVTAFLHEQTLGKTKKLNHVSGDVLDAQTVVDTMQTGFDVVISCLGNSHKNNCCSDGIKNIINACYLSGNARIVVLSSLGVAPEFNSFYFNTIVGPLYFNDIHTDLSKMEKIVENSKLLWTIVRPALQTNKSRTTAYRSLIKPEEPKLTEISRADVADFIMKEVLNPNFIRQKVAIGY